MTMSGRHSLYVVALCLVAATLAVARPMMRHEFRYIPNYESKVSARRRTRKLRAMGWCDQAAKDKCYNDCRVECEGASAECGPCDNGCTEDASGMCQFVCDSWTKSYCDGQFRERCVDDNNPFCGACIDGYEENSSKLCEATSSGCTPAAITKCEDEHREPCSGSSPDCGACVSGYKEHAWTKKCVEMTCDWARKQQCSSMKRTYCKAPSAKCGDCWSQYSAPDDVSPCTKGASCNTSSCTSQNREVCPSGTSMCGACLSGYKENYLNNCVKTTCDYSAQSVCTGLNREACSGSNPTCGVCKAGFESSSPSDYASMCNPAGCTSGAKLLCTQKFREPCSGSSTECGVCVSGYTEDSSGECHLDETCDAAAKSTCDAANKEPCSGSDPACGPCKNGYKPSTYSNNCVKIMCTYQRKRDCKNDYKRKECKSYYDGRCGDCLTGFTEDPVSKECEKKPAGGCDTSAKTKCADASRESCSGTSTTCGDCLSGYEEDPYSYSYPKKCKKQTCTWNRQQECSQQNRQQCYGQDPTCGSCLTGYTASSSTTACTKQEPACNQAAVDACTTQFKVACTLGSNNKSCGDCLSGYKKDWSGRCIARSCDYAAKQQCKSAHRESCYGSSFKCGGCLPNYKESLSSGDCVYSPGKSCSVTQCKALGRTCPSGATECGGCLPTHQLTGGGNCVTCDDAAKKVCESEGRESCQGSDPKCGGCLDTHDYLFGSCKRRECNSQARLACHDQGRHPCKSGHGPKCGACLAGYKEEVSGKCLKQGACDSQARQACRAEHREICFGSSRKCGACTTNYREDNNYTCIPMSKCDYAAQQKCASQNRESCVLSSSDPTCGKCKSATHREDAGGSCVPLTQDLCDAKLKDQCKQFNRFGCQSGSDACGACFHGFREDITVHVDRAKTACISLTGAKAGAGGLESESSNGSTTSFFDPLWVKVVFILLGACFLCCAGFLYWYHRNDYEDATLPILRYQKQDARSRYDGIDAEDDEMNSEYRKFVDNTVEQNTKYADSKKLQKYMRDSMIRKKKEHENSIIALKALARKPSRAYTESVSSSRRSSAVPPHPNLPNPNNARRVSGKPRSRGSEKYVSRESKRFSASIVSAGDTHTHRGKSKRYSRRSMRPSTSTSRASSSTTTSSGHGNQAELEERPRVSFRPEPLIHVAEDEEFSSPSHSDIEEGDRENDSDVSTDNEDYHGHDDELAGVIDVEMTPEFADNPLAGMYK